jgi:hypothetical protein
MRPAVFSADVLRRFLRRNGIATLPQLKQLLGTEADITVFRKLKELSYRTSYSHRGSFYTLDEIATFDEQGLWSFDSVWFSRYGTLVATTEDRVTHSEAGYFASELEDILHVPVKEPLLQLVAQGRIARQLVSSLYLYCAGDLRTRQQQLRARQSLPDLAAETAGIPAGKVSDELRAAIVLFASLLDEQQRRLYAGLESLQLGGDRQIAELLGLDPHTVAKGRRQLLARDVETDRVRAVGGGRKPVEKNTRGDRCHPQADGKGNCRRPDQRSEVDQKNYRKDRLAT